MRRRGLALFNFFAFASLFTAAAVVSAQGFDEDEDMSYMAIGQVRNLYKDGNKIPNEMAKLKPDLREALETHFKYVSKLAKAAGLKVSPSGRSLEMIEGSTSEVGKRIAELKKAGVKAVIYDPAFLEAFYLGGSYDSDNNILNSSRSAIETGKVDSLFHHEGEHALNWLDKTRTPTDLRLTFEARTKKMLREDALIYPKKLHGDEIPAYISELEFLLKDPSNTEDINPETGITIFQDKTSMLLEVTKTALLVTSQLEKADLKIEIKGDELIALTPKIEVNLDNAKKVFAGQSKAGIEQKARELLAKLHGRSVEIEKILATVETAQPIDLVERLKAAIKD